LGRTGLVRTVGHRPAPFVPLLVLTFTQPVALCIGIDTVTPGVPMIARGACTDVTSDLHTWSLESTVRDAPRCGEHRRGEAVRWWLTSMTVARRPTRGGRPRPGTRCRL